MSDKSQSKAALQALKQQLEKLNIDYFLLPNSDEFLSEYLPESEKRLQFITGFSGSNAYVIIGKDDKCAFFTDGRYTLQAQQQVDADSFQIHNLIDKTPLKWLSDNVKEDDIIAFDPKLHSKGEVGAYLKQNIKLKALDKNPVDAIWKERIKADANEVFIHPLEYSGESTDSKLEKIIKDLDPKSDVLILNHPASICWLLNIRSSDVQYTPLSLCYAAIHRRGVKVELFIDEKRLNKQIKQYLPNLRVISPDKLSERILSFKQKEAYQNVQIDGNHSNYWLYSTITNAGLKVIDKADPCLIHKACKNETEINETIKAHEIDGLAVTKFLFWLNESVKKGAEISEISASDKLLELRKQSADFLYPSFASISGFGSNGAVIHYCATQKTNKKITGNSLYLIDSGGQYPFGTTDITRTVAIGKPTEEQIEDFTRVLKGHIALARAKFPVGVTGNSLDALARYQLWQAEKDYDHGTGHGVGSFLSVHEGPQSISKRASTTALKEGMIISNEPGYYKAGEYGIRIENLVLVQKLSDKFLHFKTITLAPIDPSLINFKMMTYPEKKWLKNYHQEIYDKLASKLNNDERNWLKKTVELYEI